MSHEQPSVLIVDDAPEHLAACGSMLADCGVNVVTAASGADALKEVLQHDFALIVLDLHMPELDGFETATLIRNRKRCARMPIVFVTQSIDDVHAVESCPHAEVDYLPAPVVPESLRARVRMFADLFRREREANRQSEAQVARAEERARRQAELETDRRKDEFLAMLAHELRNPLAPICNATHLLRLLLPRDAELSKLQDIIQRQLGNLTRLVDGLLDVSRITTGKIRLTLEPIDIAAAATTAVETSRPLIDARRQELTVSLPSYPLPVLGDQTRLAQVLANLLNNAAKYTPEEGHISLTVTEEDGSAVCRVRDDGVGIPLAMLPNVFDLFVQAEQSLDRSQGGLGIGLTIARKLMEMHAGTIEAVSTGHGQGSEFIVRMPLAAAGRQDQTVRRVVRNGETSAEHRVLVVDDNQDAAQILAMLLDMEGYETRTAHDGVAALQVFEEFCPRAVFLDVGLPGMDGYAVARRLRQRYPRKDLLLVAVTGYGSEVDQSRSQAAGFDHHLIKPVRPQDLQKLLQQSVKFCGAGI
jgi:signal transduction histidine kinase